MSNIAISYARFSSAGQAEGHSLVRQIERAAEYAAANNLVIDQKLSFRDLGVSGWDRSNIEKGALGLLLKAVNDGKVPVGATLIVESFDRLSRAEPIDALSIFQQIIGAGLNLVTLTEPPRRFNRQTLRANPFQLFEALLDMHRANAESDRKSDLLSKSWAKRRQNAVATKAVMTSKAPLWIRADGPPRSKTFHLIPERVEVVKRVLQLAKSGVGNHTIIKTLNLEGVPSWPRSQKEEAKRKEAGLLHTWEPSYIQKMLSHPALYGAVKVKGDDTIEGYYPPIIAYDEFVYLQSLRSVRATRKTTSRKGVGVTNLFSGLLRCGYCESQMIVNGYTRANGEQFKYVACHGARTGKTACRMHAWSLPELESHLLFWVPEGNYSNALGRDANTAIEAKQQELALIEKQYGDLKLRLERVYTAIEEGATGMVPRAKQYELEITAMHRTLKDKRAEVEAFAMHSRADSKLSMQDWIALRAALAESDPLKLRVTREQLSSLVHQIIDRVVMFPMGHDAMEGKGGRALSVHFKSGLRRHMVVGAEPWSETEISHAQRRALPTLR